MAAPVTTKRWKKSSGLDHWRPGGVANLFERRGHSVGLEGMLLLRDRRWEWVCAFVHFIHQPSMRTKSVGFVRQLTRLNSSNRIAFSSPLHLSIALVTKRAAFSFKTIIFGEFIPKMVLCCFRNLDTFKFWIHNFAFNCCKEIKWRKVVKRLTSQMINELPS